MSHGVVFLSVPLASVAALLYLYAHLRREPADAGDVPRRRRTDIQP